MKTTLETLRTRLLRKMGETIREYDLIDEGARIMVCLSGGKDSYTLLDLLLELRKRAPVHFDLVAFHLDQRQPGYPPEVMEGYLASLGPAITWEVWREDTYSVVREKTPEGGTPCSLCSRLRRGIIYTKARQHGCTHIALGHHRDDSIETLLLNLFYSGQIQAMPATYRTEDDAFDVIRPMISCGEDDIAAYAEARGFPIIPCTLCGSHPGKRAAVKRLLGELEAEIPHLRHSMLAALRTVRASHLLDRELLARLSDDDSGVERPTAPVDGIPVRRATARNHDPLF